MCLSNFSTPIFKVYSKNKQTSTQAFPSSCPTAILLDKVASNLVSTTIMWKLFLCFPNAKRIFKLLILLDLAMPFMIWYYLWSFSTSHPYWVQAQATANYYTFSNTLWYFRICASTNCYSLLLESFPGLGFALFITHMKHHLLCGISSHYYKHLCSQCT